MLYFVTQHLVSFFKPCLFITVLKTIIFLYNGHFFYLLSIFGTTKKDSSQVFGQNQSFYLDKLLKL